MAKFKDFNKVLQMIEDEGMGQIINDKSSYEKGETRLSRQNYFTLDPAPYDTGDSYAETFVKSFAFSNRVIFRYIIDNDYSIYFTEGLGSNWAYGKRNPIKKTAVTLYKRIKKNGKYKK